MNYKAPDNSIHFLDDDSFANLLPIGSTSVSPEEAAEIKRLNQPAPTMQQIAEKFTAAIQHRLDNFARTRNYDGILSASTYATSTVPKFQQEGQDAVNLRDQTWAAAYQILSQVLGATRPIPDSIADIEADLPPLNWTYPE